VDHFSYFMLRLRHREEPAPDHGITGIVQQLSTGEKRAFTNVGELLDLLLDWARPPTPKLGTDYGESNAVVPEDTR
jgi:hypothetical protein